MSNKEYTALQEKDIKPGDYVSTPFRGGRREGYVKEIVMNEAEARKHPTMKRPPKVVFVDQHGHEVAHNPSTLTNHTKKEDEESDDDDDDDDEQ